MGAGPFLRFACVATLICCESFADSVAEPSSVAEPISLEYEAAAACPSREEFGDTVRLHSQQFIMTKPDEARRRFSVRIEVDADRVYGTLNIEREGEGATPTRRVDGENCDEVAEALALAMALALDPVAPDAPDEPEPRRKPRANKPTLPPREPPPSPPPSPPPTAPVRPEVGLHALSYVGAMPGTVFGGTLEAGVRWPRALWGGLSLRGSVGGLSNRLSGRPKVRLEILPSVRAVLCPIEPFSTGSLRVPLCIGAALGRVRSSASPPFSAAGTAVRLSWSVDLGARPALALGKWLLEAQAGMLYMLREQRYLALDPDGNDVVVAAIERKPSLFLGIGVGRVLGD